MDLTLIICVAVVSGGMMTERLGCEASDLFAGLVPDASAVILGQGGDAGLKQCDQSFGSSAVNYLHFHGTGDSVVPWSQRYSNTPCQYIIGISTC